MAAMSSVELGVVADPVVWARHVDAMSTNATPQRIMDVILMPMTGISESPRRVSLHFC
jgi:hypothetical protein